MFGAVIQALCTLLELEKIEVENRAVWATGDAVGKRVPSAALSDGYLTMAGWYLDLVVRWVELADRYKVPIDRDFTEKMMGLVLLDEIDVHLHPEWQSGVIPRVRKRAGVERAG